MGKRREDLQEVEGAKFVRYFGPILDALRALGGSGTPKEVTSKIAENLKIPETEQNELLDSGMPRFPNQVAWARQNLVWEGLLDSSKRGVWSLTEKGYKARLSQHESREIFLKWVKINAEARKRKSVSVSSNDTVAALQASDESLPEDRTNRLLVLLKSLSPSGFERLSQRLLRESGFEEVIVTGKTGDGGIDGNGVLRINPFVSFQVLFQCKKYDKSVTSSQVRDFRGAMMGRADKGIIITTGTFTSDARKEAMRDGVPPIELVDGEKLIEMFERLELGLKPKTTYEIDEAFFNEYLR